MISLKDIPLQRKFKVLLIGDSCIDQYYYGNVTKLNPEAPVPILSVTRYEEKPGMAGNVKSNLESFGLEVTLVTGAKKCTKKRYIDIRSKQHIVRIDEDVKAEPLDITVIDKMVDVRRYDAVVVSDYNKGFVSYELLGHIQKLCSTPEGSIPVFLDTKKQLLDEFKGCFIKINALEFERAVRNNRQTNNLIVTRGEAGTEYMGVLYPPPKVEVVDICGAGDTFLASLTYGYLCTKDIPTAIEFANKCSAICVTRSGVYSLGMDDLRSILE